MKILKIFTLALLFLFNILFQSIADEVKLEKKNK